MTANAMLTAKWFNMDLPWMKYFMGLMQQVLASTMVVEIDTLSHWIPPKNKSIEVIYMLPFHETWKLILLAKRFHIQFESRNVQHQNIYSKTFSSGP